MSRALALAGRLLRAAAGLAVTAALLAGLPWGLARFTGSPLPRAWPRWQQVQGFLTAPLTDSAIIRALADAAWLLWAVFAVSVIIETASAIRGQPAPRLPALAPAQALAAALAGATLMAALHAQKAAPRAAQPMPAELTSATTITAPLLPGQSAYPATAAATKAERVSSDTANASRPRVYRVKEGDDLWAIAERYLGGGENWHQLYHLNEGRPQPDGRALADPGDIYPGWVLLIPRPGHAQTGSARQDPAPAASSPARVPGGSHPAAPPAPLSPQASQPASPADPPSPPAGTGQQARPPGPAVHGSGPSHAAHPGKNPVRLPSGALIGVSVALMVAAALTLAAIQRRRRYRPRPGPPDGLQPDPQPLPDVIRTLRRAARPIPPAEEAGTDDAETGDTDASGQDPYLDLYETAAEPDHGGDAGEEAPAPEPAGQREPEPELPGPAGRAPGVIPLGVGRDGGEAAVNVAALGGLGLTGPGARPAARAILATLLAQAPPPETGLPAAIIPAPDAARLLPGTEPASIPGVSVPATFEAALGELEGCLLTVARTGGTDGETKDDSPGTPGAQSTGPVLIAEGSQGSGRRLAGILETGRRTGVTAVLLGAWDTGVTCETAADGTIEAVSPPAPDLDGIQLYTLGAAEAAAIAGVLEEAHGSPPAAGPHPAETAAADGNGQPCPDPHAPAGGQRRPEPGARTLPAPAAEPVPAPPASPGPAWEPQAAEPPAPGERPVQVSLLGPLRITAGGQEISGGLRKARELLAYLAVHPGGASGEAIAEALWPEAGAEHATSQRNLALRKARDMLRTATGLTAPMWILNASGRYRLDPDLIATDFQAFGDALDRARQAAGEDNLAAWREAAALYRGELADGEAYEWAEPFAEAVRRRALDAWTAIADILQPGDPDQALSALEAALGHDAYNEYLYQRIMRLQAAAGRPEAVRRTLRLLEARLADIDVAPSSRTRQVAASLLGSAGPARHPEPEPR